MRADVYISPLVNDDTKIIRGRHSISRTIAYHVTPFFFQWIGWILVLGAIKYFAEQSGNPGLYLVEQVGIILIGFHFLLIMLRFNIDAEGRYTGPIVWCIYFSIASGVSHGSRFFSSAIANQVALLQN